MSQSATKSAQLLLQKADIDKLPSLPHALLQLLDICHDESPSFSELATVLRQDPGLYARICSVYHRDYGVLAQKDKARSPGSQPGSQIEFQLKQLGINTIKSIAVTAAVQQFFSPNNPERTEFLKQHWQHSTYCAVVAQSIAKYCDYNDPDEAYSTGLLHDIGQLAMDTAYPEKYISIFAQLDGDDYFHNLEQDTFDTTHQRVGAELLKKHGVNSFIYDAVLYHHEPAARIRDAHPLVKIINLANSLISDLDNNTENQQIFDDAKELLGLDKNLLLEILQDAKARIKHSERTLEIIMPTADMSTDTGNQLIASDEYKHLQLAEQVRNIALLDGLHQQLSRNRSNNENQQALLAVISQQIGILFGVDNNILFLYDAADDRVHAVAAQNQPSQLTDISIPLRSGRSLVSDSLLNKQAKHSFERELDQLSIVDRQLLSFTEQEGIICLPMMMNNVAVGALVMGVGGEQREALWKQLPLLMRFVNEVAHTITANSASAKPSVQKNQMQQMEQKIHEVLHEVRNPLSIMNNYLGILSYKLEKDKPAQEDVQTIKAEIERISLILKRLTETESTTDATSPVDINAIIADLTHVFQTSLFASKNIQISLDLDERIESLNSNTNALKQIYTNLVKNAVEALPANGQLMVYTQDNVNVDGKEHIEVSVADDGPGIDSKTLSGLFSPVETTKGGDHAGLGLTIVKKLVNELNGSISCRSSDKGTSFHILLPK
ncbi:MAG: HDOD domain-containing protein [Proteobacteria bacterium]|nr:HDOD domain-containing protein [Pseudomonadota bacterium]